MSRLGRRATLLAIAVFTAPLALPTPNAQAAPVGAALAPKHAAPKSHAVCATPRPGYARCLAEVTGVTAAPAAKRALDSAVPMAPPGHKPKPPKKTKKPKKSHKA